MRDYLELLRRNRNYRWLWLGALVSYGGDWFNLIASAELLTRLTDSSIAISYLFLARFLPQFFTSPFAGWLADRFNRRNLMVASDVLRAVVVLGFLFVRNEQQVWLFYALTVAQFMLSTLFVPARTALLANVVDKEDLVTANGLDGFTWSGMLAIGALLGGIVAQLFGATVAFVLDAATFLLSAYFIARVHYTLRAGDGGDESNGESVSARAAFRYLLAAAFILPLALVKAGGSLVWGATNVLEVDFAEKIFPLGAGGSITLGLIYAATGLGTGTGPLLFRRMLGDRPKKLVTGISLGYLSILLGMVVIGSAENLLTLLGGSFIRTIGSGTIWVFSAVLLQTVVPDHFRGRVFAFEFAMLTLTQSASILLAGVMQDRLGLDPFQVVWTFAAVSTLILGVWLLIARRFYRSERYSVAEPST